MTWLVTGGAGFIGAHVVHALHAAGEQIVVLDDLSTGVPARIADLDDVPLVRGSVQATSLVAKLLREYEISGVVHVAAKKQPGESVDNPLLYYRENVGGLESLLRAMTDVGVDALVFSSSASTYGDQETDVLTEDATCRPVSPYGETKLVGEWMIADVARSTGLRYVCLRYFNAAGAAAPELADTGAFNLIPMVFERLTSGLPPKIFGDDYPTPDGTTIRDYIHVGDIASAHVAAARHLTAGHEVRKVLNVGTGRGSSTREIVETILDVSGHTDLKPEVLARRPGDPAVSIAGADRIREVLGWSAEHDMRSTVAAAWQGWLFHHPEAGRENGKAAGGAEAGARDE
ncbi:UDP-glucose 4-epimerase GalE [Actinopolymorpha singaporensis]|uniref:UDP-glucose 4-epimerase n=1 Tax=Actinopolymorpha singaporensis TaxID=117157 RepID=A0A1H1STX5_9ACTN|nr:UDP-glucose 4-epimerase GalE [Actinopolymorpha singaporensis]SDS51414.1 UDP-glucose 4-epimerase [Actinopolymorpha singaporensis]